MGPRKVVVCVCGVAEIIRGGVGRLFETRPLDILLVCVSLSAFLGMRPGSLDALEVNAGGLYRFSKMVFGKMRD